MSTDAKPAETPATPAAPKKPSAVGGIVKLVIPALLAAGAAYGGTRAAAAHTTVVVAAPAEKDESPRHREPKPPGPTVALEPFLLSIQDAKGKGHAMKLTIAIEFEKPEKGGGEEGKEGDAMKPFAPRIRDAILSYVRAMSYEEASDGSHMEKVRTEMLERCHGAGAVDAVRVLVTDFVIQ